MADINNTLASDDDKSDELDIEGDTQYLKNIVDEGEEGEPGYQNPNDADDAEKEAETIEPEPRIEDIAKEPTDDELEENQ